MAEQKKEKMKIFEEAPSAEEGKVEVTPAPEAEKKIKEAAAVEIPPEAEEGKAGEKVTLVPPIGQREEVLPKDQAFKRIEEILEEDLGNVYLEMTPAEQKVFKAKGEEAASKIRILIQQVKIRVKDILELIKKWLSYIPGVNKYFLEQEAKIKTDKILEMTERKKK